MKLPVAKSGKSLVTPRYGLIRRAPSSGLQPGALTASQQREQTGWPLVELSTPQMGQGEIDLSKKAYLTELSCKTDARGGCGGSKWPNLIAYLTRCFFRSVSTGVEQRKTASG